MTDFNQKTHDTDVGSHGGLSRQMMEVFENQEFGSIRVLQEAGKTFFCASDVAKALGYVNPYAAVKRHCRGPLTKREGVVQKVHQSGISILTLKEESNWTLADAEPYIESLIAFYQDHHQTTFRVMEASEVRRLQRIPCRQVLQEIFDGKFIELKNGMLRYKQ